MRIGAALFVHIAHVRIERALLRKSFEAHRARIWLLSRMHSPMHFQVVLHREPLSAQLTRERLLTCVCAFVVFERVLLLKPAITHSAHVRTVSRVDAHVLLQVRVAHKPFPAKAAHFIMELLAMRHQLFARRHRLFAHRTAQIRQRRQFRFAFRSRDRWHSCRLRLKRRSRRLIHLFAFIRI